jgi:hypothetical protein
MFTAPLVGWEVAVTAVATRAASAVAAPVAGAGMTAMAAAEATETAVVIGKAHIITSGDGFLLVSSTVLHDIHT